MARGTNARIETNLRNPRFRKLLEKARLMVPGNKAKAAYHLLKHMNLSSHENNLFLFLHIPDRQLAELLGIPGGKTAVWKARDHLIQKRRGIEKVVKNVDTSNMKVIGRGNESVYLYYFPAYKLNSIYYVKYVDDSHETPIYACNIGKTIGDVKARVSAQIGQQLPEKARIALIIKTDDCYALETKIHDELKRRGKWLDPNSDADVVGVEWFLTNLAEVEGIVKSIHRTENSNE